MRQDNRIMEAVIIMFLMALALLWAGKAWSAEVVDTERLVIAIGKAENSWGYKPYGVMMDYCKPYDPDGQCKKGAVQTIEKWKKRIEATDPKDFIRKFAEVYAPTKNATNDPKGLNRNWYRNVWAFYSNNSH